MIPKDVDVPMGNAELRLTLAGIESEVSEIKGLAMSTNTQAKLTNGHVADAFREIDKQKKFSWLLMGGWTIFVLFVVPALGITMYKVWSAPNLTEYQIKQASQQGAIQAFEQLNVTTK